MGRALRSNGLRAVISGLLLTAAFPKPGLSVLAWLALVPLLTAVRDLSAGAAFRAGMIAGLAHYLTLLYWVVLTMRDYGYLPWWQCLSLLFLLAAYLAVYPGLFAMALARFGQRPAALILLAPIAWVALEFLRSVLLTGFPWGIVGYSQFNRLHIIQVSDMFGVYGVSFLVVCGNMAGALLLMAAARHRWQGRPVNRATAALAAVSFLVLLGLTWTYGSRRIEAVTGSMAEAGTTRVAVVQGNIDQARKWDPAFQIGTTQKYVRLTRAAAADQPDLVVWPETATPFYFGASAKLSRLVTDVVRDTGIHLLVGSPSVEAIAGRQAHYNSAFMVTPDGRATGRYDKVHLVPFGEYVPLKRLLFFAGKMVAQVGDFSPGEKGRILAWGASAPPVGVQICFEIIFPGLSRSQVNNGAGLLVNLTNDAWFGKSAAAYQHFAITVFRAVENRRALVRSANTGISGFVDPIGRVAARTALFEDAVVVRAVPVLTAITAYTRFGDLLALACLTVMVVLVGRPMVRKWRGKVDGGPLKIVDWIKQRFSPGADRGDNR
jgi:apolipoprotein N-acyltransferase